jgi:hypothetical protein
VAGTVGGVKTIGLLVAGLLRTLRFQRDELETEHGFLEVCFLSAWGLGVFFEPGFVDEDCKDLNMSLVNEANICFFVETFTGGT